MIKFDYSFEEAQRLAALEDERGAFGDPCSIGGYAQGLKRAREQPTPAATTDNTATRPTPRARKTLGSRSRHDVRFLAMANAEVRA